MNNRIPQGREFIWYILPTCFIDIVIYHIILICTLKSEVGTIMYNYEEVFIPLSIINIASYVLAILIVPIQLNNRRISYWNVLLRAIYQILLTIILFCGLVHFTYEEFDVNFYLTLATLSLPVIVFWHLIMKFIINSLRQKGNNTKEVIIIGADENAISLYDSIRNGYGVYGYNVLGFFTDYSIDLIPQESRCIGKANDVFEYLNKRNVHEVYCCVNPAIDAGYVNEVIRICENHFISFYYLPNMDGYIKRKLTFEEIGSVNVLRLREEPLQNPINKFVKRVFDIIVSSIFLITIFPVIFLIASIGIKISSPGPVFFRQARTGYKGTPFKIYKFRTMHVNADSGRMQATQDDPRKFRFGDFLRRTSIDELPQFINIFLGDMSLIGPRPHMEYHTEVYSELIDEYLVRHLIKPGLSGWAQVNGCRGETKTVDQMKQRVIHDIWYIEHWTFGLDVKIILMTIRQVIRGDKQAY